MTNKEKRITQSAIRAIKMAEEARRYGQKLQTGKTYESVIANALKTLNRISS